MQIGRLDQRIKIQELTTVNDKGSLSQSYSDIATVWAMVKSQRGNESFEAARVNARETIRIKMRYRSDVTDKHRIEWESQNYNIVYVDRSNKRDGELWLTCEVVGAD